MYCVVIYISRLGGGGRVKIVGKVDGAASDAGGRVWRDFDWFSGAPSGGESCCEGYVLYPITLRPIRYL